MPWPPGNDPGISRQSNENTSARPIITGLNYVANGPIFRRILLRAALFVFPASALLALLPVAAAHRWHLGASGYGVALGAIGVGAVLAVAVPEPVRHKVSPNALLVLCAAVYGVATLAVAWLPFAAAVPFLVLSGITWLITLTTLNAAAQLHLPRWVRARGLSMYLLVFTGSQAVGSYLWGVIATRSGVHMALLWSAALLGVAALSVIMLPLLPATGKLSRDISRAWPAPMVVFEPRPNDGPVLRRGDASGAAIPAAHGRPQLAALSKSGRSRHDHREVHRGPNSNDSTPSAA